MSPRSRPKATGLLMSSAADSPAKTSALPEKAPACPAQGLVFGTSSLGSFAKYDPSGSLWRTCERSLLGESTPYSGKWPTSGMTRNGIAYRLAPLVPRTAGNASGLWRMPSACGCCDVADAKGISRRAGLCKDGAEQDWHQPCDGCCDVADARGNGRQGCGQDWSATGPIGLRGRTRADEDQCVPAASADWWVTEPDVGRVAHGVPSRVDRLRCLGNAVVPQIVEIIGRAIIDAEGAVASQA